MAVIDFIDGPNRRIYLHADTVGNSVHPVDIYREMRELRRTDESLRRFDLFLRADGNVPKGAGKFTERYVTCLEGTRIVPYDVTHLLTITGTIITDDGQEGISCFDRATLAMTSRVDIAYVPPQVEVIEVQTGATPPIWSEAEKDSIISAVSALPQENADAVWNTTLASVSSTSTFGAIVKKVLTVSKFLGLK